MSPSFSELLKAMFSCAQLPVSGNILRHKNHHNHSGDSQPLFLTTQRPYSPVSSTSIGRWLKLTLQDAGIDISVFKAYSTIVASSSAARQRSLSFSKRYPDSSRLVKRDNLQSLLLLASTLCFFWHSSHFLGQLL